MEFIETIALLALVILTFLMLIKSAKRKVEAERKQMDDIKEAERRLSELRLAAINAQSQDARKVASTTTTAPKPTRTVVTSVTSISGNQKVRREVNQPLDDDFLNPTSLRSPLNPIYQTPSYESPSHHRSDDCGSSHSSSHSHSSHSSSSDPGSSNYSCDSGSSSSSDF
jgi:type II secretory pathway pseudopilin PulG